MISKHYQKVLGIAVTLMLSTLTLVHAQFPDFPPEDVDRVMDRDQMLDQLGITFPELPPKTEDPNAPDDAYPRDEDNPDGDWTDDMGTGNTITRSSWGLWNNYHDRWYGYHPGPDSAMLGDYPPIDLLEMNDGTPVTTQDQWWNDRRPEILKDVGEQMWGVVPDESILPDVTWETSEIVEGGSGDAAYKEKTITGNIDISRYPDVRDVPEIQATVRVPANATQEVPVMVIYGGQMDTYWNYCYPQGWGVVIYNPTALQPDNGAGLTSYLIGLVNQGEWRQPEDWGSLAAWGWGISRLIDYFESPDDNMVDAQHVGVSGHSRYGKATLVTMAYDQRVFIAFPSDAGALGTAMNRRHYGQNLENSVWDQEYHWMAGNFMKWGGEKNPGEYLPRKIIDCPVDAHSLMSLCAPRPVYVNGGNQSTWIDPYGVYLTTVETTPVYELLGAEGIIMNDPKPEVEKAYIDGDLAYRYHDGGHTDEPDWPDFWNFAAKYIQPPVLSVSNNSLTMEAAQASTVSFDIASNKTWTITSDATWIDIDVLTGDGDATITATANEDNSGTEARSATLSISVDGLEDETISINQASTNPTLAVSGTELNIAKTAGSEVTFDITSNSAWSISSSEAWLTPNITGGINNETITLSATANSTVEPRTAIITISGPGITATEVTVTQEAADPTLTVYNGNFSAGPASAEIEGAEGSSLTFYAQSNTTVTAEADDDWLSVSVSDAWFGDEWNNVDFSASANPSTTENRTTNLNIMVEGLDPHVITVTQLPNVVTSIENIDEADNSSLLVFPNPFKNSLNINVDDYPAKAEVYSMNGNIVYSAGLTSDNSTIDLGILPKGSYMVIVTTKEEKMTSKIVKQ